MNKFENTKHQQINTILSVVKLASLLFCGIICFKYLVTIPKQAETLEYYDLFSIIVTMSLIGIIYIIWSAVTIRHHKVGSKRHIQVIENIIFIGIFLIMILVSGGYASPYKFLFLFIITITTIQSGMKQGMSVACISAGIVLLVDLICVQDATINTYFEDDLILAGIFILTAWPLGFYVKTEKDHIAMLQDMVNYDGLTKVYNHRFFHDTLNEKITVAEIEHTSVSLLFIDIDYFKHYNDLNGHQKGDEVLKTMGHLLKVNVRESDIVARYGGEEFAIILPDTDKAEVIQIAERLRQKVEETHIMGQENQPTGNLTISIGIATYPYNAKSDVELIKSADDALYRAKFFNKNRVEVYTSVLDELKKDIDDEDNELITSIKTLISVINAKDKYTYGHSERVVIYSRIIADKLGLSEKDKKNLVYGAYMHDIGKINISEAILNKKMPLDFEEWEILKKHSESGVEIIKTVASLEEITPLILYHHERYDGKGYPVGLKGEEIPFLARILTVVDGFDAMTSNRPYNKRKTDEEAFAELRMHAGKQFDSEIVEAFIEAYKENKQELQQMS